MVGSMAFGETGLSGMSTRVAEILDFWIESSLRSLQQKFNLHGVEWKDNPPILCAIQNAGM